MFWIKSVFLSVINFKFTIMRRQKLLLGAALVLAVSVQAQQKAQVSFLTGETGTKIPKEIYGQFAEHLGTCIYGGLWVGENSSIPNTNGYRNDVLQAFFLF